MKLPKFLRAVSYEEAIARQLEEAKHDLLAAQSQQEYFTNMVKFLQVKIERLTKQSGL